MADRSIIYYVAGALTRSEINMRRGCGSCKSILVAESEAIEPPDCVEFSCFTDSMNRGRLLAPTDASYALCVKAWAIHNLIKGDATARRLFLRSSNHRKLFVVIMQEMIEDDLQLFDLLFDKIYCSKGHSVLDGLVGRFFNTMMKNFVREITEEETKERTRREKERKKWKLAKMN